jgi:two-component system OmpR family sensor kinase
MPVRIRVAAAFAVAMALVLTGAGFLIYALLGDDLANALDQDLRLRAQDVSALVRDPSQSLARQPPKGLIEHGESFAELLDSAGGVLDSTRPIGPAPLIGPRQIDVTLAQGSRFIDLPSVPGLDEGARLLATPVTRGGRRLVLVVGATRENRAETLRSLRTELLIAGPIALVLATLLGYLLAGAGLRTVEAMRKRAASISAETPGERLPVPRSGDELQRLGETLNDMLARLEEAIERERGFVAEAGHELRTPLALLRAELDYALHYAGSRDELRAAIRTASQETDRLVQLAGDLLLIASADKGRIPLRQERVQAEELLESVRKRFAWRADADARRIEIHTASQLELHGDRVRLEQALGNLVDNALRYGDGAIELIAARTDHRFELHVRDRGAGFPPTFLPHALQRFTRADASRSGTGIGLGLAIVSAIATAHGGQALAANASDGGADVMISLPARVGDGPA